MRKKPKQERSRWLVDTIIQGGLRILRLGDYEKMTTSRIAEVSGVSIGSLYQYFKNRDSVVSALIETVIDENLKEINAQLDATKDAPYDEMILKVIDSLVDLFISRKSTIKALLEKASGLNGVAFEMRARKILQKKLVKILEDRHFHLQGLNIESFVFMLIHSVGGVLQAYLISEEDTFSKAALKAELKKLVRGYLLQQEVI